MTLNHLYVYGEFLLHESLYTHLPMGKHVVLGECHVGSILYIYWVHETYTCNLLYMINHMLNLIVDQTLSRNRTLATSQ